MTNDELFPTLEMNTTEQANFKENVYFKPRQDFKINVPHDIHIVRARETSSLFKLPNQALGCSSWDRENGFDKNTKEKVSCEECPYRNRKDHKGLTINEGGKDVTYRCSNNYALFMEHPEADKEYVLTNINWKAYIEFDKYRRTLIARGLDVPGVITRITRVEPAEGNGYMYEFEFVSELNLNMTEAEKDLMDEIKLELEEECTVAYVADLLNTVCSIREIPMDIQRAKRLVEDYIGTDGVVKI
jgi:hypothetical protein